MNIRLHSARPQPVALPAAMLAAALALAHFAPAGQDTPAAPATPAPASTNVHLKEIRPGIFQLGKIQLNQAERSLTFPAVFNMTEGIVEYLLVASFGKTHESVLRTEVDPYQLHVAMLLLGATGAGTNTFPDHPDAPLPGDPVLIETRWTANGSNQQRPAETLVHNRMTRQPLSRGPWTYTGSILVEGSFIAQLDGSIASLITDPNALINNPRPGRENDELWMVRSNGLPEIETPVAVTLKLPRNAPPQPARSKTPPHSR